MDYQDLLKRLAQKTSVDSDVAKLSSKELARASKLFQESPDGVAMAKRLAGEAESTKIPYSREQDLQEAFKDYSPSDMQDKIDKHLLNNNSGVAAEDSAEAFNSLDPSKARQMDLEESFGGKPNASNAQEDINNTLGIGREVNNAEHSADVLKNTTPENLRVPNESAPMPIAASPEAAASSMESLSPPTKPINPYLLGGGTAAAGLTAFNMSRDDGSGNMSAMAPNPQPTAPIPPHEESPVAKLTSLLKPKNDAITLNVGGDTLGSGKNLSNAMNARDNNVLLNQLGRAGELVGTGIAGTVENGHVTKPVGQDIFAENIKNADQPVKDYESRIANEKNDPNSAVSRGMREFARKFGVNLKGNISANNLEKLMPMIYKSYEAQENRDARKDLMSLKVKDQLSDKNFKKETAFRGEIDKQTKDIQNIYDNRMQLIGFLDDAIKHPTGKGFQDVAINYGFIKGRDNSSVREGEQKLLQQAGSIPDRLRRTMGAALRGESYNKDDMTALQMLLKSENRTLQDSYRKRADTILKHAKKEGLDSENIISRPDIFSMGEQRQPAEMQNTSSQPQQNSTRVPVKKEYSPSRNATRLTYSDGSTEVVNGKQ